MPSLRKPLSIKQKLIALYTDPNLYVLADHIARTVFHAAPGTPDYRRHVTCFLLDVEARVHANRQQTQLNTTEDRELWNLRRSWAHQVTGRDVLLARSPTAADVRKWRERWIHPDRWLGVDYRHLPLPDPEGRAEAERLAHAEKNLRSFVGLYERLAMDRAREVGQFGRKKRRDLVKLRRHNICQADGTYVRAHSHVDTYRDPVTEELQLLGNRNRKARLKDGRAHKTRIQKSVNREKKEGRDTMGVNHVAVLTRTDYGRVILGVEQATGGEVRAALKVMDRVAPLTQGAIHGLAYDKALNGWPIDYLLARHGIVSIAPPLSAEGTLPEVKEAHKVADWVVAERAAATALEEAEAEAKADAEGSRSTQKRKPKTARKADPRRTAAIKYATASRVLGETFNAKKLVKAVKKGNPVGAGLPLGTSIYLTSSRAVVAVHSKHQKHLTYRHDAGGVECAHELHVDDGALWDTRTELSKGYELRLKDQRLTPMRAETTISTRTGWHELSSYYRLVCKHTGEILTIKVDHTPQGKWVAEDKKGPKRTARHNMMLLARCDAAWREIYSLRNDCESWFAWLKMNLLEDKRAASLDLNHQLLDVLYAGLVTNAITAFNYQRERHF